MKTERLKKIEAELKDLRQWLKLGLVPKKDIPKHEGEITMLEAKMGEEKERILFLKESGDLEEYYATKRMGTSRGGYPEGASMNDIELNNQNSSLNDANVELETNIESTNVEERNDDATETLDTESDDLFTGRRWSKGVIDPDSDEW